MLALDTAATVTSVGAVSVPAGASVAYIARLIWRASQLIAQVETRLNAAEADLAAIRAALPALPHPSPRP
jgi:hypothetical protein